MVQLETATGRGKSSSDLEPDKPLEWEILRSMVDDRINQILEATGSTSYSCYLTDSASNFRLDIATIVPYKGTRKQEKPYHWQAIRQHLIDNYDAEVVYGIEADDKLGIEQWKRLHWKLLSTPILSESSESIICSRDKDLHMIPGWHYTWQCGNQKERLWFQDETSAIRCFYKQLLTGDTADNILGLYGVGSKSKLVQNLDKLHDEQEMFNLVFKAYKDRFGSYAYTFMLENGMLLWIKREDIVGVEGHKHNPALEIETRLNDLLEQREDDKANDNNIA